LGGQKRGLELERWTCPPIGGHLATKNATFAKMGHTIFLKSVTDFRKRILHAYQKLHSNLEEFRFTKVAEICQ
jgi:hypothetical protein